MESGNGGASLEELLGTVRGTIKNLENKRSFLKEQLPLYQSIFDRIGSSDDTVDDDEEHVSWQYGEIVSQNGKFFQNIGYDYYLEKSKDECLDFIKMRINLISEAIKQFDEKLVEASGTLKNMESLQRDALAADESMAMHENEEGNPFMEIREELDEDGNVVDSSVTPADKVKPVSVQSQKKESPAKKQEEAARPKIEEIEEDTSTKSEETGSSNKPINATQIATENMYTFDDLVKQLDELDEEEDGEFDAEAAEYDFDAYDEDDEEDDEDDLFGAAIVPEKAQLSFMDQINALRQNKLPEHSHSHNVEEEKPKSILKKSSKKKSVNFAPKLDVFEVDNLKQETKSNTFNFPRRGPIVETDIVETQQDVEFDPDLFAQMIGVKGPDALHDRYQKDGQSSGSVQDTEQPVAFKKKRVSRFKRETQKDAGSTAQSVPETEVSVDIEENDTVAVVNDIVERVDEPAFVSKEMKSLSHRKKKLIPPNSNIEELMADTVEEASDSEPEDTTVEVPKPMEIAKFPTQEEPVMQPTLDFSQLEDLDDMARAYQLGLYDDDLDDLGAIVEKTSDFEEYNKLVEAMTPKVTETSPVQEQEQGAENTGPMVADIVEKEPSQAEVDIELQMINAQVEKEYLERRRTNIDLATVPGTNDVNGDADTNNEELGREPIDEYGNPVTTSRFKTQTLAAKKRQLASP